VAAAAAFTALAMEVWGTTTNSRFGDVTGAEFKTFAYLIIFESKVFRKLIAFTVADFAVDAANPAFIQSPLFAAVCAEVAEVST